MKELEIVFTRSKKKIPIGSWLIRLWTWKPYSHVARKLSIKDWGCGYYQANEGKVNYEFEEVFDKKHKIIKSYTLLIDQSLEEQVKKECWRQAGKKYGFFQNLGIIIVDILNILGIKIENPWKSGKNCSEIIYEKVLMNIFNDLKRDPDLIKPHHIEDIILDRFIKNKENKWIAK